MTNTAQDIRRSLKAAGYSARQVSVRMRGGSADVTIRQLGLSKREIERLACQHANYRRDDVTGDILRGGNTFVFVRYADDAILPLVECLKGQIADGAIVCDRWACSVSPNGQSIARPLEGDRLLQAGCPEQLAYNIAVALQG